MLSSVRTLHASKLTLLLAVLLAGSVTYNILAFYDINATAHSAPTANAPTVVVPGDSAAALNIASAQQQHLINLRQIAILKADIATHLNTVALLHRERAVLLTEHAQTGRHLEHTKRQLAATEQRLSAITSAARRVGNGTGIRLQNAMTRRLTTMTGQAVPVVGTVMTIGSVGYDVHDLCVSMNDIADLNRAVGVSPKDDGMIDAMCRLGR